jgi:hypothetical protein
MCYRPSFVICRASIIFCWISNDLRWISTTTSFWNSWRFRFQQIRELKYTYKAWSTSLKTEGVLNKVTSFVSELLLRNTTVVRAVKSRQANPRNTQLKIVNKGKISNRKIWSPAINSALPKPMHIDVMIIHKTLIYFTLELKQQWKT